MGKLLLFLENLRIVCTSFRLNAVTLSPINDASWRSISIQRANLSIIQFGEAAWLRFSLLLWIFGDAFFVLTYRQLFRWLYVALVVIPAVPVTFFLLNLLSNIVVVNSHIVYQRWLGRVTLPPRASEKFFGIDVFYVGWVNVVTQLFILPNLIFLRAPWPAPEFIRLTIGSNRDFGWRYGILIAEIQMTGFFFNHAYAHRMLLLLRFPLRNWSEFLVVDLRHL